MFQPELAPDAVRSTRRRRSCASRSITASWSSIAHGACPGEARMSIHGRAVWRRLSGADSHGACAARSRTKISGESSTRCHRPSTIRRWVRKTPLARALQTL